MKNKEVAVEDGITFFFEEEYDKEGDSWTTVKCKYKDEKGKIEIVYVGDLDHFYYCPGMHAGYTIYKNYFIIYEYGSMGRSDQSLTITTAYNIRSRKNEIKELKSKCKDKELVKKLNLPCSKYY